MSLSRVNATAATLTKNRTEDAISHLSGMCATCVDGCIGMCEIGKSAYRGAEVIYPQPFGIITVASEKNYPVDLSHFTILGTVVGAQGVRPDPDEAIFPNVSIERKFGRNGRLKARVPITIPALGSTAVAKNNWEGLAIGAALAGVPLTIGENVCAMDPKSEIVDGKVVYSPELEWRVRLYKEWQQEGYGTIVVQANVEDTRLGAQEYALRKLGVEAVELKWGQGAKNIGGEVKVHSLEKAKLLKKRGYVLIPDPDSSDVVKAFQYEGAREFERHSRVGMVNEEGFLERVKEVREAGAKYVSLKTGAYRPVDLARAIKFGSKAQIDLLTVDAAGGGTGMSPWRMMNEWGVPGIHLWSLLYEYAELLSKKGEYVPDIAIAGGFSFEDQIFKGLALGAPHFKLIGMARAPLAAAMVGKTIGKRLKEGQVPVYIQRFGSTAEEIFVTAPELKQRLGANFERLPTGAIGLYTYIQRLAQGLRQIMCGSRKFALEFITRDDIAAITTQAAEISGIDYIMKVDKKSAEQILDS